MRADADGAPGRGGGALDAQRALGAGGPEVGGATAIGCRADRRGPAGTANGAQAQVDVEAVFAEPATGRGRRLGLALRLDPGRTQSVMKLAGAVGPPRSFQRKNNDLLGLRKPEGWRR
ncbi:MAG: hypothetical protein ACRDU4_09730 [Mycobacterium sp.]